MKTTDIVSFVMMFVVLVLLTLELLQRQKDLTEHEIKEALRSVLVEEYDTIEYIYETNIETER